MEYAIETTGLTVAFGRHTVLDGLDLCVAPGEVFALLGPNGAGKTTTINVLTTLVRPDGGRAQVAGADVAAHPDLVRRRISLTGQTAAVDEVLTGAENLVMMGRLVGLSPRDARTRATDLLHAFDLAEAGGRRVGTYSGGMRRRLDLALSFIVPPRILFLDEPTTGLDTRSRRDLWEVIRGLAAGGTTVFLTTQYLEEADRLADRIAVLNEGRIVAEGTATELKARVGGDSVRLHGPDDAVIREIPTDGSVAGLRQALDALDDIGAGGTVTLHRPTLDDVFLTLTDASRTKEHA
ncbi:MAG: ATP-binding cassette domain-containing protein [Gemmatimonadota bacterium]|nr:ATP-binding cassette domain-containing protein [Gemmatimonadota bacterium]